MCLKLTSKISKEKDDENTSDNNEIELPTRIPELKADKDGFTNNPIFKKKNSNDLFDFEEYSRYKHHEQSRKYKKTFRPSIVFRDVDEWMIFNEVIKCKI